MVAVNPSGKKYLKTEADRRNYFDAARVASMSSHFGSATWPRYPLWDAGIWARRVGDKEARNEPASHRATGRMVKVTQIVGRGALTVAPKKINHDGY
jgi:hypothetical protein